MNVTDDSDDRILAEITGCTTAMDDATKRWEHLISEARGRRIPWLRIARAVARARGIPLSGKTLWRLRHALAARHSRRVTRRDRHQPAPSSPSARALLDSSNKEARMPTPEEQDKDKNVIKRTVVTETTEYAPPAIDLDEMDDDADDDEPASAPRRRGR